jgi:L-iditol 2-dehydrogenase
MKMKQSVLIAPETFELREIDVPKPQRGEVLLKVKAVGICGSDIHTYHGAHPFVHTPIVMGHEVTGKIVELGTDVQGFSLGDRVVIRPQRTCGKCRPCRQGRYNICKKLNVLGCLSTGASSDYFAVESSILYKLPDHVSFYAGTLLEPLAVGIHAVKRGGGAEGKNILVTGAGTIGLMVAQAAKATGAASVMITDVSDFKLDLAKKCGIPYTVNVTSHDLKQCVTNTFGEEGLDLIIECSAVEAVINQAIDIATKGTNIVIAGVFESFPRTDLASVQDREYSLNGSLMYTHEDYVEAISMAKRKAVYLDELITKTFTLEQNKQAFEFIDQNKNVVQKVILAI